MLPILLIMLLKLVPKADATGKIYQIGYLTDSQGASSSFWMLSQSMFQMWSLFPSPCKYGAKGYTISE